MRYYMPLLLMFASFTLASCAPSRERADIMLAVACEASVKATFTDPKDHIEVKKATFAPQKAYDGARLRVVTLKAQYTYGESQPDDKTYTCAYTEEWSLLSYLPEFYNMQKGDEQYGNFNGTIVGDTAVLMKINDANQKSLH